MLESMANNHLVATFTFSDIDPARITNNTEIICRDELQRENNETFFMAGKFQ